MTATPAPALTAAEAALVDRFGVFEPEEREAALVETVARAMWDALPATPCGWDGATEDDRRVWLSLAAAAIAAYRSAQDGGAEEAVSELPTPADEATGRRFARMREQYRAKAIAALVAETRAKAFRAALATQAGDGAR